VNPPHSGSSWQSWKTIAHASLSTQSARKLARKYRLEQHIPNETLDFPVKFRFVFRCETVVFRIYVLALLLVGLLRKFEAYLTYLRLIWGKISRRFSCFQKFRHFSHMFPGFPRKLVTCAIVFQLCRSRSWGNPSFRHGTQFFRGCYSRDAWTAEATFSQLPETKWRECPFTCFDFVS